MSTNPTLQTTLAEFMRNRPTVVYVGDVRENQREAVITALNAQDVQVVTKENLEQLKDKNRLN